MEPQPHIVHRAHSVVYCISNRDGFRASWRHICTVYLPQGLWDSGRNVSFVGWLLSPRNKMWLLNLTLQIELVFSIIVVCRQGSISIRPIILLSSCDASTACALFAKRLEKGWQQKALSMALTSTASAVYLFLTTLNLFMAFTVFWAFCYAALFLTICLLHLQAACLL